MAADTLSSESSIRQEDVVHALGLNACFYCDARDPDGKKLRRCGGCSVALYCDKDCQKAAWREHKLVCRMQNPGETVMSETPFSGAMSSPSPWAHLQPPSRTAEFTSVMELCADLKEYRDMHDWAFAQIVASAAHFVPGGGVEEAIRANLFLNFTVIPVKGISNPNPANSWILEQFTIHPVDALLSANPNLVRMWGDARPEYRAMDQRHKARNDPGYLGLFPVLYTVKNTNHSITTYHGLYRPRNPDLVRQQSTQDALMDMVRLCETYICQGFPLRRVEGPAYALPGRMVRKNKTYKWTPLFNDWHGQRIDFGGLYTFKTKMCPSHLMDFCTSL